MKTKTKDIVLCGIITAVLCVLCPVAIPAGAIPITLSTLVIYIITSVFNLKISLISITIYILIGCIGLPVFSGFSGGIAHILGPSGGFIIGYFPMILCISLLNENRLKRIVGMCLGTALLYICGCSGFALSTDNKPMTIISVSILPFIPGDTIKIITADLIINNFKDKINTK